jgi:hypothetical protein
MIRISQLLDLNSPCMEAKSDGTKSQPWIVNESGIGNTCSSLLLCAAFSPD